MLRLVVGADGSGRTHRLRVEAPADATWLTGSRHRLLDVGDLDGVDGDLVVDDAQFVTPDFLSALADLAPDRVVWLSRSPWPEVAGHALLDDLARADGEIVRLGRRTVDEVTAVMAGQRGRVVATEEAVTLHAVTGGWVGLVTDAVGAQWTGDLATIDDALADRVRARLDRLDPELADLVVVAALADDRAVEDLLDVVVDDRPVVPDPDAAEAALAAAGILDDAGRLVPVVGAVARRTAGRRARLRASLALGRFLADVDPVEAARHLIAAGPTPDLVAELATVLQAGAASHPGVVLDLASEAELLGFSGPDLRRATAEVAFRAGRPDLVVLEDLPADDPLAGPIGFGLDLRELRWADAGARAGLDPTHVDFVAVATASDPPVAHVPRGEDPISRLTGAMALVADGAHRDGVQSAVTLADDLERGRVRQPLGVPVDFVVASLARWSGDPVAEGTLLRRALERLDEGDGEHRTVRLALAHHDLVGGRLDVAADVLSIEPDPTWPQRDRLLYAAFEAAVARRSGDTDRLRQAWARSESTLLRPVGTWLLFDVVLELLVCGARLGDERRLRPVADEIGRQLRNLPPSGAGATHAAWLELQLAIGRRDDTAIASAADTVASAAAALEASPDDDRDLSRPRAMAAAAGIWRRIATTEPDEDAATAAADAMAAAGDPWEASRLLGQTALDHPDPAASRRLLERARALGIASNALDGTDDAPTDGLAALGLSEREIEVAMLVTEGRTHKEVGAQLFISPKTVEHHVARIRNRIGASTRAEMMAIIRRAMGEDA